MRPTEPQPPTPTPTPTPPPQPPEKTYLLTELYNRILQWALNQIEGAKLGVETGTSIGEMQQETKKPEPEKLEPPKEPTPTPQPPQKFFVEGSPIQRTIGNLQMIVNE